MAAAVNILNKRKFPLRRQSTSTSQIPLNASSDVSIQRTNDSPSTTNISGNGSSSSPAIAPNGSMTPQSKMITAAVTRIKEAVSSLLIPWLHSETCCQLPIYSGNSLVNLEADAGISQVIEGLVEQSKGNPDHAVWHISEALGNLEKRKVGIVNQVLVTACS